MTRKLITAAIGMMVATILSASANTITVGTPSGSTLAGFPVNSEAIFTTGPGSLSITLKNLQSDPTSVIQNLSGLSFALTTGQTSGSLIGSSGMERSVANNGTFTDGATVSTGWGLSSGFTLNVLGTAIGPAHTLIGGPNNSNIYGSANGSIAGNGPHNPFLAGSITFNLSIAGVTADSSLTDVIFRFGTTAGNDVPGTPRTPPTVPDAGSTMMLLGMACASVEGLRRKLQA
jgi:hypothetical protein